jgi:hypothetical protein
MKYMHMHVRIGIVRTTIEMKPEHRSALLALAARRGEKGFSAVVADAIEEYLKGDLEREKRRTVLLSLAGSLEPEEAQELRRATRSLRESWR